MACLSLILWATSPKALLPALSLVWASSVKGPAPTPSGNSPVHTQHSRLHLRRGVDGGALAPRPFYPGLGLCPQVWARAWAWEDCLLPPTWFLWQVMTGSSSLPPSTGLRASPAPVPCNPPYTFLLEFGLPSPLVLVLWNGLLWTKTNGASKGLCLHPRPLGLSCVSVWMSMSVLFLLKAWIGVRPTWDRTPSPDTQLCDLMKIT